MLHRKSCWWVVVSALCSFALVGTFTGCGSGTKSSGSGGSGSSTIVVSITSPTSAPTIQAGQTVNITAAVSNDSSNQGVTWSVSGGGTLSNQTSTTVTYNAPASVAGNTIVTVKATSAADSSDSTTLTITVTPAAAIAVRITNPISTIAAGASAVTLNATVQNDSSNSGVTWTLTVGGSACSPSCGALSAATTASVLYTPPSSAPASPDNAPTISATSIAKTSVVATDPFTITGNTTQPVSLQPPSTSVPGAGIANQSYAGSIQATNGVGSYTWLINGTQVTAGGYSLGDSITAKFSGANNATLSFSGLPTTAETLPSFTVEVEDSGNPQTTASNSYSIQVSATGAQIGGQISLSNSCGSVTLPSFTVTLTNAAGALVGTQSTDANGDYSFASVPYETYTVTPSIPGASSSVFYPASYSAVASASNITGDNFSATVGYTISGTVSYTGGQQTSGQIYLTLTGSVCGGQGTPGTSVAYPFTSGGSFSIRGVPPGTYGVSAYLDPSSLGQGAQNFIDPTGSSSSASSTTNANSSGIVSGATVQLSDPTFATPTSNPSFHALPINGGWLLYYSPPSSGNGVEAANEYIVNWAQASGTDSDGSYCLLGGGSDGKQFATSDPGYGTHTFSAIGANGPTLWILNNKSMGTNAFSSGKSYCFQVRAVDSFDTANPHPSGAWASITDGDGNAEPVTPGTSTTFCSSNCTTVSGAVTVPAGVTIKPNAALYMGVFQQSASSNGPSAIYATETDSPVSGGAGNQYSLTVPNGSGYVVFGILDQNNDGLIDAGDVTNVRNNNSSGVNLSGGSSTQNLTLPATNSVVQVQTNYYSNNCNGCTSNYSVNLDVYEGNLLPVAVTLTDTTAATPYVMTPVDLGACSGCGTPQFQYSVTLPSGSVPSLGDSFGFTVTYLGGYQETGTIVNGAVTAFGNTGAIVGPSDLATNLQTSGSALQPNFTWTYPANAGDYLYNFSLNQNTNCSGDCTLWQIPNNNSNSNGFTVTQDETTGGTATTGEIEWNQDPTGGGSSISGSLNSSDDYSWQINVQDTNGNQATSTASDDNP